MMDNDVIAYCLKCKKVLDKVLDYKDKFCECGSKVIVYGKGINLIDKVLCECGNDTYSLCLHINYGHKQLYSYNCNKCNCIIGKEVISGNSFNFQE